MALIGAKGGATRRKLYDVFLSFRGEDTREGFTTKLHTKLKQKGISTFMDNEGLKRGEVISKRLLEAIEGSSISIIILSQNYAFSTWCLDELQKIVESRKDFGQQIWPVFYGVDPSHVRHQRGDFEEAFAIHEGRFKGNRDKIRRWRDALTEVANTSGWDSRDYQDEGEVIESIVGAVWSKLYPKPPSVVDTLHGVDSKIEDLDTQARTGLQNYYTKQIKCCCFTF